MNKPSPLISFIIPCGHYHAEVLEENIRPLIQFGNKIEIIVVHDWKGLDLNSENLITIETPFTSTRSYNRNAGAKKAKAPWLIFMDADVSITSADLEKIYSYLGQMPHLNAATVEIETIVTQGKIRGLDSFLEKYKRLHPISLRPQSFMFPVLDGAFIIVSHEVYKTINGFEDTLFWDEDLYFTHKLAQEEGFISALTEIKVQERFRNPELGHFMVRYFLSGLGNGLFFKEYLNQSPLVTLQKQTTSILWNLFSNYKEAQTSEEKSIIILLRLSQMFGSFVGLFYHSPKVLPLSDFHAKIVIQESIYHYRANDGWKKII